MANIEEKIEDLVKSKINSIGYELYDVLYVKEGPDKFLRIVIDKDSGIDLNDCETVNNAVKDMIDEADYIKEQYFLEISSPGIERLLRKDWQLKKYIGEEIQIKQFRKDKRGEKDYIGILKEFDDKNLKIQIEKEEILLERKNISQIKTTYKENFKEE